MILSLFSFGLIKTKQEATSKKTKEYNDMDDIWSHSSKNEDNHDANKDKEKLEDKNLDTEITTTKHPIQSSNIGYKLLQKMGWDEKSALGKQANGIITPITVDYKVDTLGLGKKEEFDEWTSSDNIKRKLLSQEIEETEDERIIRVENAKKLEEIKKNVVIINRPFYCEICDKQYKRSSEMETHLSSYDHNHTKVCIIIIVTG